MGFFLSSLPSLCPRPTPPHGNPHRGPYATPPMKGGGYGPRVGFPMGGWYGAGGIGIK